MKKLFVIGYSLLVFIVSGCQQSRPLATASGKPEATVTGHSLKKVRDFMVNEMIAQQMTVKSSSDFNIVFSKPLNDLGSKIAYGSNYDRNVEHRVILSITEWNSIVKIVLTNQIITNPNSAFERVTDISDGDKGESWWNWLKGTVAKLK